jgi:hypothetical protein
MADPVLFCRTKKMRGVNTERNRMNVSILLENSTPLCLAESWARTCAVLVDRPLSAAYWKLGEMTGEEFLDELAPLQVDAEKKFCELN